MRNSFSPEFKLFSPLLFIYRWLNFFRRRFVKGTVPPIPAISIGNLAFGGTGKTPVTIAIAKHFLKKGKKVAIAIRGYGGKLKDVKAYPPGEDVNPCEAGDEASVLRENLKDAWIIVGKKREISAELAAEHGADLLILDDGFQYLSLKKVEVVLHSSSIPEYYLREPLASLKFAHFILIPEGEELESEIPVFHYKLKPVEIPDGEVFLVCGIAHPERFFGLFESSRVKGRISFPDHWSYNDEDLKKIYRMAEGRVIVTTEKDFVKLKRLSQFKGGIKILRWIAELDANFLTKLEEKLKKCFFEVK